MMTTEQIARVCHDVNRAYCQSIGDHSQLPWDEAPLAIQQSAMRGVVYALEHPDASPEDQHAAWCRDKIADGWSFGEVKDADRKTHWCLVPYDELPRTQRAKDHIFLQIVRSLAALDRQPVSA